MKTYKCIVPFLASMGSVSPFLVTESTMESKEEYALYVLNDMRNHDGLKPFNRLPDGVTFILQTTNN